MADTHRVRAHAAQYQPRTSHAARAMDGTPKHLPIAHAHNNLWDSHTPTHTRGQEKGRIHPFQRLVCAGVLVCWRCKWAPRCEPDALTRVPSTGVYLGRTRHPTDGSLSTS